MLRHFENSVVFLTIVNNSAQSATGNFEEMKGIRARTELSH